MGNGSGLSDDGYGSHGTDDTHDGRDGTGSAHESYTQLQSDGYGYDVTRRQYDRRSDIGCRTDHD